MPLAYGGGVRSLDDATRVVSLGIEKVILNDAAWHRPSLISDVAGAVGSCSTVVCLDIKRSWRGRPRRYSHLRRRVTADTPVDAAIQAVEAGAGELILQDVNRDGSFEGTDIDLVGAVCSAVPVPVTVLGGVASLDHVVATWKAGGSGVSAGSWFVFQRPHHAVLITYPPYDEIRKAWDTSRQT